MKSDILIVNPGNQRKVYQDLSSEFTAIDTPTWALLIADYLRRKGFTPALYDTNPEGWDENTASELLSRYNPELVLIPVFGNHPSASTQTMPAARFLAKAFRNANPQQPLAISGTHPSALPERTLREEPVDFVVSGEGAETAAKLLEALKGRQVLSGIEGLSYLQKGIYFTTPADPPPANLDETYVNYAWDLLPDLGRYRAHNWHCFQDFKKSGQSDFADVRSPYVSIYTSLGCPYSCSFCCINALFGKPGIRYWSIEKVVGWLEHLNRDLGVRNFRFADELFILSEERTRKFCNMVIDRGLDLNIWVYGRVDTIKPGILEKLRMAGVTWMALGIESASEMVRSDVNKKIGRNIKDVVSEIRDHGISVIGNYMFGLPEDTVASMQETLKLALDLNTEFINMYAVMPYPGSRLYDEALKTNDLPETWGGFSHHSYETLPMPTRHISAADVLQFRDDAFMQYVKNPGYLEMIQNKFGTKVVDHIVRMSSIPLKRRILGQ